MRLAVRLRLVQDRSRVLPRRVSHSIGRLVGYVSLWLRTEVTSFRKLLVDGFFQVILFVRRLAFKVLTKVMAMTARTWYSNLWCRLSGMLHSRNLILLIFIFGYFGQSGGRAQAKDLLLLLLKKLVL